MCNKGDLDLCKGLDSLAQGFSGSDYFPPTRLQSGFKLLRALLISDETMFTASASFILLQHCNLVNGGKANKWLSQ